MIDRSNGEEASGNRPWPLSSPHSSSALSFAESAAVASAAPPPGAAAWSALAASAAAASLRSWRLRRTRMATMLWMSGSRRGLISTTWNPARSHAEVPPASVSVFCRIETTARTRPSGTTARHSHSVSCFCRGPASSIPSSMITSVPRRRLLMR